MTDLPLPDHEADDMLAAEYVLGALDLTERAVAHSVVAAAQRFESTSSAGGQDTAAYYLIGPGRAALESSLRNASQTGTRQPPAANQGKPANRSWRLAAYLLVWLAGTLAVLVADDEWAARTADTMSDAQRLADGHGLGRELLAGMRRNAGVAEEGACTWL